MKISRRNYSVIRVYNAIVAADRKIGSIELAQITHVSPSSVRQSLRKLHSCGAVKRYKGTYRHSFLYTVGDVPVVVPEEEAPKEKKMIYTDEQQRQAALEATQRVINRARQLRRRAGHSPFHCLTAQLLEIRA